jgi:DNA-binding transcriptional MerR regulator
MAGAGYRIGELARLSGLSVKTIRFYSDRGLLPPAERTEAGYRVYDDRALARLELIRALRELGASLADVERVLSRELDVPGLVALQLEAVEAQLRVLRVRRAVLIAIASREPDGQELRTMTRLAQISDDERKRIVEDFLDEVLGGLEIDPGLEARLRGTLPDLPDDPTPEQVEAWVELAELVRDPDFRARIRGMAEAGAAERREGEAPDDDAVRAAATLVGERGGAALEAGIVPGSEEAEAIVAEIVRVFGGEVATGEPDRDPAGEVDRDAAGEVDRDAAGEVDRDAAGEAAFRAELADRFEQGADPRAERYWQLLAVINGWAPVPTTMPAWRWTIDALRARPGG